MSNQKNIGWITRFSLDRRVTVLVMFLTVLVVGAVTATGIPVELIPKGFTNPFLMVIVPWQDAPPAEVLEKITEPLEEELSTVKGLERITTVSGNGRGLAFLAYKQGTDMDVAYREVRDRIERARRSFPDDVDQVFIRKDDSSGIPVFIIGAAIDPNLTDPYDVIEREIRNPLTRVEGVANVEAQGHEPKEVLIELDRARTEAAGLNIFNIAQDMGRDNFTLASGHVREGSRKLLLRSIARYKTLDELKNRPVTSDLTLGDIANVKFDVPEKNYNVRAMSRPAVALVVFKEGDANTREVAQNVEAAFQKLKSNPRLSGLWLEKLFDQGMVIDESLTTMVNSGMVGGFIALFVLLFFLRRVRLTIVIALSIPVSLLIGLTVMYFGGETLNILTLLGLMICVGLLVDNSVVVAENIYRLHNEGATRRDAVIRGAGEMALAITMSTLTTIVVFLPVALVEGPGQFFLMRLAVPVSVSLAASLGVALIFIPLCVYLTLPQQASSESPRRLVRASRSTLRAIYEQTFGRIGRQYNRLLAWSLNHRFAVSLAVLAIFGAAVGALGSKAVEFVAIQEESRQGFEINVDMPDGTTFDEADEWFMRAEKAVEEHREELDLDGWFIFHRTTFGEVSGWFRRPRTNDLSPREATERVKAILPEKPGMELFTDGESNVNESEGEKVYKLRVYGEDARLLEQTADSLRTSLSRVDGVLGAKKSSDQQPNEMGLVIDRARAQRYGADQQIIAGLVSAALRGSALPKFSYQGREIPVRVRFQESDRNDIDALESFMVPTAGGAALPVGALVDARMLATPNQIVRRDKRMSRSITLELEEGSEEKTRKRLDALLLATDLPEGVSFRSNIDQTQLNNDLAGLAFAAVLSVVFIYLLMGFLFESFMLPLSILLTLPPALVGVVTSHLIAGRDIDFLGVVGMILLIGVVVNNGIVLIDYLDRLRKSGMDRTRAILVAAERRFRPIMMTAITTIAGLIPLALAEPSSIGMSYTSFSLTLIGGLTVATLLTLLVVPIFYSLFDDARHAGIASFANALRWLFGRFSPTSRDLPASGQSS